jgi:hypothetical protein
MALSTQSAPLAKRRAGNYISAFGKSFSRLVFTTFWSWIAQMNGSPDLQVVEFGALDNTDVVVADAACSIYAIVIKKPTATAGNFKAGDSATTCPTDGSGVLGIKGNKAGEQVLFFPQKLTMASGFTIRANTTATGSASPVTADKPAGMVILGA